MKKMSYSLFIFIWFISPVPIVYKNIRNESLNALSVDYYYRLHKVVGNTTGTFEQQPQEVTYVYQKKQKKGNQLALMEEHVQLLKRAQPTFDSGSDFLISELGRTLAALSGNLLFGTSTKHELL